MLPHISYNMYGFNSENRKYSLRNNQKFIYKGHPFIDSVYINDEFNHIFFELKKGLNPEDYADKIRDEVERICFNIIAYTDISTSCPSCKLKEIIGVDRDSIKGELSSQVQHDVEKDFIRSSPT